MNSRVSIFVFLSLLQKSSTQYLITNLMNVMYFLEKTIITTSLLVSIMSESMNWESGNVWPNFVSITYRISMFYLTFIESSSNVLLMDFISNWISNSSTSKLISKIMKCYQVNERFSQVIAYIARTAGVRLCSSMCKRQFTIFKYLLKVIW